MTAMPSHGIPVLQPLLHLAGLPGGLAGFQLTAVPGQVNLPAFLSSLRTPLPGSRCTGFLPPPLPLSRPPPPRSLSTPQAVSRLPSSPSHKLPVGRGLLVIAHHITCFLRTSCRKNQLLPSCMKATAMLSPTPSEDLSRCLLSGQSAMLGLLLYVFAPLGWETLPLPYLIFLYLPCPSLPIRMKVPGRGQGFLPSAWETISARQMLSGCGKQGCSQIIRP